MAVGGRLKQSRAPAITCIRTSGPCDDQSGLSSSRRLSQGGRQRPFRTGLQSRLPLLVGCHLVLVSERKLPAVAALGADEIPLTGLTPRESILFTTKLGLDLRGSLVEFGMLSVQVGGHPI